ncbi:MAG: Ig domain-containing protein [Clostridia bacterium]|nr:Ig domain-containing protein [Clostridia bacterium]
MKRFGLSLLCVLLALMLLTAAAEPALQAAETFDAQQSADGEGAAQVDMDVPELEEFQIGEEAVPAGEEVPEFIYGDAEWDMPAADELPEPPMAQPLPLYQSPDPGVIVLYRLYDGVANRVPLPEGALTSYHIDAAPGATFEIIDPKKKYSYDRSAIFVSDDGTVYPQDSDSYENNVSDVVVRVHEGEAQRDVRFHIINYGFVYASAVLDRYLATEINSSMTELEKLIQVTRIAGRDFDYSTGCSDWGNFILYGAGDCWASTSFILEACARLGISATGRDARGDSGAGSGHVNVLATLPQGNYICDAGYNGYKPRYWYVRKEDGTESYSPSYPSSGSSTPSTAAPNVITAEFDAVRADVGQEASFSVVTDPQAKSLYMYDAAGTLLAQWNNTAVVDGTSLCWKPKYTFSAEGVYELTFKASADGNSTGASVTLSVEARTPKYDVRSVNFGSEPVAVGTSVLLTMETGPDALSVAAIDESGKMVYRWLGEYENLYSEAYTPMNPNGGFFQYGGNGKYVINYGDKRVWHVPFEIWTTGDRRLTFCATTDDNSRLDAEAYLASDSKLTVDLHVAPIYIKSVEVVDNPGLGEPVYFRVITPNCNGQLAMYDESGTQLDTWAWNDNRPGIGYVCSQAFGSSNPYTTWTVSYTPDGYGRRTFSFRCKPQTNDYDEKAGIPYSDPASVTVDIPDHVHAVCWSGYVAPTCTTPGYTEGEYCSICGVSLQGRKAIPPTGHTPAFLPAVAASCAHAGNSEGSYCATCGAVVVPWDTYPVLPHTPVADPGYAPSCTVNGLTDGSHCAVCGQVITPQQVLYAPGHNPVYVPEEAPHYQVAGHTEGSYCSVCGTVLEACEPIPALIAPEVALPKVKNNGTVTVSVGEQRLLIPTFAYDLGWEVSGYKSSKTAVANVSADGLVTATAEGKAKITVTTDNKKVKATITIQVVDPYKPTGVGIIQGKSITLTVGQPVQLYAALAPETARATLTWKSSKTKVATVDAGGIVTPLAEGKAKITVTTHNKKKATIAVTVVDPYKPLGIGISQGKAITLKVGEGVQLWPVMNPATARSALTWKSGKAAVAAVDANGYVVALKKGKAKITVTTYNKKKATITVNVVE